MTKEKSPHPIDVHVGARVKLRRTLIGMSQDKLGEALGLTFQQIQKYEKGVNRIGASRVFEISRVLGVPIQFLFDDYEAPGETANGFAEGETDGSFMQVMNTPESIQLCRYFSEIGDARVRRSVLDLVRSIATGAAGAVAKDAGRSEPEVQPVD
ncbi:MAG: helix-turn-helix transcriptional regulator [Pseudomonadota bacterium]